MTFFHNLFWRLKDFFRGTSPLFGGVARSSMWSSVRKDFLILHNSCATCDRKKSLLKPLEVHHCVPFSVDKSLELDMNNLIVFCKEHHLLVGHLMSFQSFNPNVREDAELWKLKIKNRPE